MAPMVSALPDFDVLLIGPPFLEYLAIKSSVFNYQGYFFVEANVLRISSSMHFDDVSVACFINGIPNPWNLLASWLHDDLGRLRCAHDQYQDY
jgi:hypothetical protein